jgi:hypothetical protein
MPANYSGRLGTALGEFVLGDSGDGVIILGLMLTQDAVEFIYNADAGVRVTQLNYELVYASNPLIQMSQDAIELLYAKPPSERMTQDAMEVLDRYNPVLRMSQIGVEVIDTYLPSMRFTNESIEVVERYTAALRVTQDAVEVLYQYIAPTDINLTVAVSVSPTIAHSSIINRTVTSAIAVAQIIAGQDYPKSVTTNIAVAQTIVARNSTIHVSVTSSIAVSPTIRVNEDRALSVTSAITVSQTITERTQNVSLSVQSNIAVSQTVRANEDRVLSVTSNIAVSQTISIHDPEVNLSVTSSIAVSHSIAFRNTVVRISMLQPIGATQSSAEHSDVSHQTIEEDIGVDCIIAARNTNVRAEIFSTLTLTATVFARSTIVHQTVISNITVAPVIVFFNPNITVRSDVHVAQILATRNTVVRLSLESGITVTPTIRHSPNEQKLQSNITVDGSGFGTAIKMYVNPVPYTLVQPVYLTATVTGGSSNRVMSVQSDVLVTPTIRTNFVRASVLSEIEITQTIAGGRDTREIAIQDNIAVAQTIAARNAVVRLSVLDGLAVTQTIVDQTDEVFETVVSDIIVNPTIAVRVVPNVRMVQLIEVHQTILARPDNNNQTITDNIAVVQNIRSSPNYQTIVQPITVHSRIRQLFQSLRSEITVDQTINQERSRLLIHKVPITQVLTATRIVNRTIRSDIAVAQTIRANHDYVRNLITHVPIAEGFYPISVDFHDSPILVPVATGIIVSATLMSIRGQHGMIVLPAAQLGDGVANIGKVEVRKSMDGTAYSYIQNTDRKKLTYKWLLPHLKVYELRTFVRSSFSDLLTLENWKGEIWMVKITKNPFEFQNQGVWERDKEYAEVEMTFEGKQVA